MQIIHADRFSGKITLFYVLYYLTLYYSLHITGNQIICRICLNKVLYNSTLRNLNTAYAYGQCVQVFLSMVQTWTSGF